MRESTRKTLVLFSLGWLVFFATLLVFSAPGCGPIVPSQIKVDAGGEVRVAGSIAVTTPSLNAYFTQYCIDTLPKDSTPADVTVCTNNEVGKFIQFVESFK